MKRSFSFSSILKMYCLLQPQMQAYTTTTVSLQSQFWQLFLALTTGLNQRLSRVSLFELNQNCSPEHHDCTDFGLKSLFFTQRVQDLFDNTIMVLSTYICTCTVSLVECTNWYSFVTFSLLCLFLEWIF